MTENERKFSFLNEEAIVAAHLRTTPYDFAFAEHAIDPRFKDEVLEDAPVIPFRGSYAVPHLACGSRFKAVVDDLESPRFRRLIERKFNIDLAGKPTTVVMMGNTTGNYNEGYAHPDSKHKIITVLLGFSREWPYERGRLRVLRSEDRNDYEFEFPPEFGRMLMFRVGDHSWHGSAAKGRAYELAILLGRFGEICPKHLSAASVERRGEDEPNNAKITPVRAARHDILC